MRNWARTVQFEPAARARPADEAEIQRALRGRPGPVRAVGAIHSWSPVMATEGLCLGLDRMCGLVEVDRDAGLARVRAGTRLKDLNAALDREGLALPVLGSIAEQSLAGATSTGTHGSSMRWGALHTLIQGLRLVDGQGEVRVLGPDHPDLPAARLSLGLLGVLSELTMQVVPAFRLVEELSQEPLERVAADLPEIARSAEWVKLWWLPHTDRVMVFRYHRAEPAESGKEQGALVRWADQRILNDFIFNGILKLGAAVPAWVGPLSRLVLPIGFAPRRRVGRSDRMFNIAMPPRHFETETAVPLKAAGPALAELHRRLEAARIRVNFVLELRFSPPDDTWLSGAYGRDTCHFGAYIAGLTPRDTRMRDRYFQLVWDLLAAHDPRPHWGKQLEAPRGLIPRRPRGAEFLALRERYDPEGRFLNPTLLAALG